MSAEPLSADVADLADWFMDLRLYGPAIAGSTYQQAAEHYARLLLTGSLTQPPERRARLAWVRPAEAAGTEAALVTARDAHFFEAGVAEGKRLAAEELDVERLRGAIYAVSVRHDWANSTDTEDRTEEIVREYAAEVPR